VIFPGVISGLSLWIDITDDLPFLIDEKNEKFEFSVDKGE